MSFDQDLDPNFGTTKLAPDPLNFKRLRNINLQRCTSEYGFNHPLNSWSVAEWGNATAGEIGEACNVAKKLIRIRDKIEYANKGATKEELLKQLASEIAGGIIYADLWAASVGIDLEKAIIEEFNSVSDRIKSSIKL